MRLPQHAPTQAHLPGCLFVHLHDCLACLCLALRTMSQLLPAGCFVVLLSVVQDKLNPFSVRLLDSLLQMGLHYSVLYDVSTVNLSRLANRILVGWGGLLGRGQHTSLWCLSGDKDVLIVAYIFLLLKRSPAKLMQTSKHFSCFC